MKFSNGILQTHPILQCCFESGVCEPVQCGDARVMFQQAQRFETLLVKHVYYYAMPTVIVRQVEVFRLQVLFVRFCGAVVCKVFNCWICQKPWVEEDGAEEEVVVRFSQPEV